MKYLLLIYICILLFFLPSVKSFTEDDRIYYREKVRKMFYHAYNGYLENSFPLDELKPISCQGMDTWGSFSLTLIDSLDTLLILGNYTEFERVVDLILKTVDPDIDINASVFETNIRVVGGLISAHVLHGKVPNAKLPEGWPCSGPLLDLAVKFADKLLPAFNTDTGMPYGTVNLKYGVNKDETPITCTAGVGTFIIEFGSLSKLTGNDIYEKVAMNALNSLWESRSKIGLVGNHIDVMTGKWTATDAAKGALLFQKPALMKQFRESVDAINKYIRNEDWFLWVSMTQGTTTFPFFQSLEAFYPGLLALVGDIEDAKSIILNYNHILRQYGVPPEFYNLNKFEAHSGREGYPLRPEIVESLMYIYKATKDPTYLEMGAGMVDAIEILAKTKCGYATIKDVRDGTIEDRMESFFLAETIKYFYLLFDNDNFIHNDGTSSKIISTDRGQCAIQAGGYIFNTEAHPIDPGVLYCCSKQKLEDMKILNNFARNISFLKLMNIDNFNDWNDEEEVEIDQRNILSQELSELEFLRKKSDIYAKRKNNANEVEYEIDGERKSIDENISDEESEEPDNEDGFGISAEKPDPIKVDPNNINKDENNLVEEVNLEVREILVNYKKYKSTSSEKVTDLLEKLRTLKKSYAQIINDSSNLYVNNLQKTIEKKKKRREVSEMPQSQYLCFNCCWILDEPLDSFNYKAFLNEIYTKHLLPSGSFLPGPICLPNDLPYPSDKYFNDITELYDIPSFDQITNAVDGIDFTKFKYRSLLEENYDLLSSPPRSFISLLTGFGQVTKRNG
ncbi:ER degradation-enhancing alpha-mannosidase-like protein 2 [Strongyloides ratti]|uniref:alpha-1,2-Mannosidase n=1 Tax=Strongyloides ratti TaxID=34506 RepID=A0A090L577_STRRB|nr:ER degradation-enhancing alpha-mannosidase-like protein 2 [Strongyloides ratti]CEF62639.1 ER degradation-enhancing alpha-mannosidase-like protein 2 [Strongyloides ratti]